MTFARDQFDVIVIGAGHNGLTAAAMLAKRGRAVLVLEASDRVGGLSAREEFHPGFVAPGVLHDASCLSQSVVDELELSRHGLACVEPPGVLQLDADGPGFEFWGELDRACDAIGGLSARDAEKYRQFRAWIDCVAMALRPVFQDVPPDVSDTSAAAVLRLGKRAWSVRRLGRADLSELSRVVPMSTADWLGEWFESEPLKCALAWPALEAMFAGPRSPATAATLLRWLVLRGREINGGGAAIIDSLVAANRAFGVQLETSARVTSIDVRSGRARSVTLADGRSFEAPIIAAACDVRHVLLDLPRDHRLAPSQRRSIESLRTRGVTAVLRIALDRPPEFAARPAEHIARARTGASLDDIERAFDAVKYDRFSERPVLDIRIAAADGRGEPAANQPCVATVLAQYVPFAMDGGWSDDARRRLESAIIAEMAIHATGLRDSIVATQLLTPPDLAQRYGLAGGHLHHGEHALDQMLVRPARCCARYATPIEGLYLCGGGCFPGGGITCLPGANAARAILHARIKEPAAQASRS